MVQMDRRLVVLSRIQDDLAKADGNVPNNLVLPSKALDIHCLPDSGGISPYDMAINKKNFLHIPTWLSINSNDPAMVVSI
jgi:hypothetical protein